MLSQQFKLIFIVVTIYLSSSNARTVDTFHMRVNKKHVVTVSRPQINDRPVTAQAFVFAKHFQDHMVLQKAPARANIYGFSPYIGQKVTLQMVTPERQYHYETNVVNGTAPNVGVWSFLLDPVDRNVTVSIKVEAEAESLELTDVIFGDVWLCSGQSNMQFTVSQMFGAAEEIEEAHNYPNIRLMTVAEVQSATPLYDLAKILQNWTAPNEASVGGTAWQYFSAVCWLYGKAIHKALGTPIGLVATDWGGTPVEAWSSPQALAKCRVNGEVGPKQSEFYKSNVEQFSQEERTFNLKGPHNDTVLWNGMINPLLGMTIYGAIWYQGEDDAVVPAWMNRYNCTFPAMIKDWRYNFNNVSNGQTSLIFPFGFVQLAPNGHNNKSVGFPDIRWHQTADWGYVPNQDLPNVFMAVAMDLPDFNSTWGSIHPQDKKDVGYRLGLSGLTVAYGKQEIFQGPFPYRGDFEEEGLVLSYNDTWNLEIRDLQGFEVLCAGGTTKRWLPTSIVGSTQTTVTVKGNVCANGERVIGLRYEWRESPCEFKKCAVYERVNSLPAPPFIVANSEDKQKRPYFEFKGPTYI